MKSNGLATSATDSTGSSGSAASASSDMIPPRHQPTSCTGRPPASSLTRRIAVGHDVVDPVLEPEVAVGERDGAVLDEVGRVPEAQQVLGQRAAAAQVEADAGAASGGTSSTGSSRRRLVAVAPR